MSGGHRESDAKESPTSRHSATPLAGTASSHEPSSLDMAFSFGRRPACRIGAWLILNVGLRKSADERSSNMKSSIAFGVGVASGAIISSTLLLVSPSHDLSTKEAEIATLREDFAREQKSAQRD